MTSKQDILTVLSEKLSLYLNKPPNVNLAVSLVQFYHKNNQIETFETYAKALGLSNPEHCKDIYVFVSENIANLHQHIAQDKSTSVSLTTVEKKPKQKKKLISFDDDELFSSDITQPSTSVSFKKLPKPNFDVDLDRELGLSASSTSGTSTKFKRINKEVASKMKPDEPISNVTQKEKSNVVVEPKSAKESVSLADLARLEQQNIQNSHQHQEINDYRDLKAAEDTFLDIDNDREWYLNDEMNHAGYDDIEDSEYKPVKIAKRRANRNANLSGGGFDELTGEYIDYDHEQSGSDDISNLPLESHFFVPPFLEDSREYLQFQIEGGTSLKSIGAAVNPIKDETSELAISAKRGSHLVQENRSKKERAKRIQETTGLSGTSIGNILGVEDETKSAKELEEDSLPLTDFSTIQKQRRSLPAFAVREEVVRTIMENQVTIIIGETGSGKTTQLTQYLFEEGLGSNIESNGTKRMIACTQPRRVAAMSVAKRVSEEMNVKLGEEVGYSIRFEDRTNSKKTIIKYMTEGILLREILADPLLESYSCVIMDEAHERSLNTDILLGLFKQLISRRRDLKLVVTSATMNADRFSKFFGGAPQYTIPGRTFPVDILHSKTTCNDYVEAAVKQTLTIHLQNSHNGNDGDILVFMTGQEDIEMTCEALREKLNLLDNPPPLDIFPIYSSLPADLQKKIFNKRNNERRKVVIATNIAETSLTVDGIKYVIDSGLVKMKVYNAKLGMDTLQVIPISLANAQQRSGRAGRTEAGTAYRLYTERAIEPDKMFVQPIPEIQRTNLSNVMLLLKSLKVAEINEFPFLDPPPPDLLNCSLYDLWAMGVLNNLGELTELGDSMKNFPIEPTLAKAILLSIKPEFQCSEDMITIVAMLSVPPVFYRPKERAQEADMVREKFYVSESDHLTLLNVYNQWEQNLKRLNNNYSKINHWCQKNFLQLKSLLRAKDIKIQLSMIMKSNKLPLTKSTNDDAIKKCLCSSFFQQSAKLVKINVHGSPEFINLRHKYIKMFLHPTSSLNGSNLSSPYVIYHELVLTSKEYMNCVTCVDPTWLLESGYVYYHVQDFYLKRYQNKLPGNLISKSDLENSIEQDKKNYTELKNSRMFKRKKITQTRTTPKFKTRKPF